MLCHLSLHPRISSHSPKSLLAEVCSILGNVYCYNADAVYCRKKPRLAGTVCAGYLSEINYTSKREFHHSNIGHTGIFTSVEI